MIASNKCIIHKNLLSLDLFGLAPPQTTDGNGATFP
jgi:hypothetical protein